METNNKINCERNEFRNEFKIPADGIGNGTLSEKSAEWFAIKPNTRTHEGVGARKSIKCKSFMSFKIRRDSKEAN